MDGDASRPDQDLNPHRRMFAMTHALRHTTAIVSAAALLALAAPTFAEDAMSSSSMMSGDAMGASSMMATDAMSSNAMSSNAMATDAMASPMATDAMMANDMAMANDSSAMGDPMMTKGKTIKITIKDKLTGQPFSPTYAESRTEASAPLFMLRQGVRCAGGRGGRWQHRDVLGRR